MAFGLYIWTDDGRITPAEASTQFYQWKQQARRTVGDTIVGIPSGHVRVKTRFLGLDQGTPGRPLLWETRVHAIEDPRLTPLVVLRCGTLEEAQEQHTRTVDSWLWWFGHTLGRIPELAERGEDLHPSLAMAKT